jgi:hypothetical protein
VAELAFYTATGLALRLAELAERMADGEEYLEEEARRLLAELTNRVTAPPPTQWGGRVQPALISKMVEALSEAAGKLALASEFLAAGRYKRLAQAARELAKVTPLVDMLHQSPLTAQAAQAPALTLPATDVARECGGLAARVLREIAARPRGERVGAAQLGLRERLLRRGAERGAPMPLEEGPGRGRGWAQGPSVQAVARPEVKPCSTRCSRSASSSR